MKIVSIVFLLFIIPGALFSQTTFRNISFEEALKLSAETGKLIFMQVESATCNQCNEVANKAFENKELITKLEQTLICIKIGPSDAGRETINKLYDLKESFGSLFIDQNKTLIHSFLKTTTRSATYKDEIDLAIYKSGEEIRIDDLEKEYKNGNKTIAMLELILQKRKSLNLETDSLLDQYVLMLPPDSLKSVGKLVFIAQMYPVTDSYADLQLRKDYDLFKKAWFSLSLPVRVNINNRIISKSMQKAVKQKNETYAYRVSSFARSTNSNNPLVANKTYESNMMGFYKETNDTLNYMIRSVYYYDSYFMTVSVDSIKRVDSLMRLRLKEQAPAQANNINSGKLRQTVEFSYTPTTQNFTRELNNGAWSFYKMTNDALYIKKALQWSKRANDFFENAEAMDTYGRLLYKAGNKDEAIKWEEKAIAFKKKRGFPVTELEAVLANIKLSKPNIDN